MAFRTNFFYWQRILRNESYLDQKQLPAISDTKTTAPVAFVELKPTPESSNLSAFKPDVIIRKKGITLEIANTVSSELLKQLGGLLHAE